MDNQSSNPDGRIGQTRRARPNKPSPQQSRRHGVGIGKEKERTREWKQGGTKTDEPKQGGNSTAAGRGAQSTKRRVGSLTNHRAVKSR